MLEQIYQIQKDSGQRVSHVVVMGTGEPLDNQENLVQFIRLLSNPHGLGISQRNITVSTCGLADKILELAKEKLGITLALSLHAPNQALRESIMPIAKKYPLHEVLDACRIYQKDTGRRVSFEYSMIQGINDHTDYAKELAGLLKGFIGHVNLIPLNPIDEREYSPANKKQIFSFYHILENAGIPVTIRREMGRDIQGACGQLRKYQKQGW
ncbi:hypothetical protein FACS189418_9290 [Clostridia bacterium]|nr:hypothetical protein FACS189418_9290 [Clostridia bacterium]